MKYYKFGFGRVTDVCGYWLRTGRITKEEAIQLIKEHDGKLDRRALADFLEFVGLSDDEFWEIAERFRNHEIWKKADGKWILDDPLKKLV